MRHRMDDAQTAAVERLRRHVGGVHHVVASLVVQRLHHGAAQVLRGHFDDLEGASQAGHEVDARDVGLGGVGQDIETAEGRQILRHGVEQHGIIDPQSNRAVVVKAEPLVRCFLRSRVGDDVGPARLRSGSRRGVDGDMGRVVGVFGLVETIELIDVAAVMGDDDARALDGVGDAAAAHRNEAVALLLHVEIGHLHTVVVLGIGLDLVVDHDVDALILDLPGNVLDDARPPEPGRGQQRPLEPELLRLHADHLIRAGAQYATRHTMELFDRKLPKLLDLHGATPPC